jgi:cob(I)alamin adenosyltransferase
MAKIYTRRGDDGTTSLGGGQRVSKDSLRVRAYGAVDELNSALGLVRALGVAPRLEEMLAVIQPQLFGLGSDLCFLQADKARLDIPQVEAAQVKQVEHWIDELTETTGPLTDFVLPAGPVSVAQLHVARTICRRAEREVLALAHAEAISPNDLAYLNRLADLLFVMARYESHHRGVAETFWKRFK